MKRPIVPNRLPFSLPLPPKISQTLKMKQSLQKSPAFSLVEITLALGVAAFALLAIFGMLPTSLKTQQASVQQTAANSIISQIVGKLRADARVPPGQENRDDSNWYLHPHHGGPWDPTPDVLFFTNDGKSEGSSVTANSVYRATIQYIFPPTDTTTLADITVSWPPRVDPADPTTGVVTGKVTTFVAINR
jgi:type II secretory pathway pseudopilin PulG